MGGTRFCGTRFCAPAARQGSKGNIVASRKHAREIVGAVVEQVRAQPPLDAAGLEALEARVAERQRAVGYTGDFATWIQANTPPDLE